MENLDSLVLPSARKHAIPMSVPRLHLQLQNTGARDIVEAHILMVMEECLTLNAMLWQVHVERYLSSILFGLFSFN